ncbi:MAG: OmpH family outer membrane protein [Ignavibacteria bacterium]|nr:OmpH family outer membrane protein [Ignavibacteria bacterium]
MPLKYFAWFLTFIFLLSSQVVFSQKSSAPAGIAFGVVDVETIVKQLPEAQDADSKLREMQKQLQDTITKMQESLQKKVDTYLRQKNLMPAEQQQKQEQALQEEQQKIQSFYNEKVNEIQNKRDEFLEPIRNKVKSAIQSVAKEENLTIVFEKGNLLYSEDRFDITFKVLDKIKRGIDKK